MRKITTIPGIGIASVICGEDAPEPPAATNHGPLVTELRDHLSWNAHGGDYFPEPEVVLEIAGRHEQGYLARLAAAEGERRLLCLVRFQLSKLSADALNCDAPPEWRDALATFAADIEFVNAMLDSCDVPYPGDMHADTVAWIEAERARRIGEREHAAHLERQMKAALVRASDRLIVITNMRTIAENLRRRGEDTTECDDFHRGYKLCCRGTAATLETLLHPSPSQPAAGDDDAPEAANREVGS